MERERTIKCGIMSHTCMSVTFIIGSSKTYLTGIIKESGTLTWSSRRLDVSHYVHVTDDSEDGVVVIRGSELRTVSMSTRAYFICDLSKYDSFVCHQ